LHLELSLFGGLDQIALEMHHKEVRSFYPQKEK